MLDIHNYIKPNELFDMTAFAELQIENQLKKRIKNNKYDRIPILVHYGTDNIVLSHIVNKIKNIDTNHYTKPISTSTVWFSPYDSLYSWYDFCIEEELGIDRLNKKVYFLLEDNVRIKYVNTYKDLQNLPNYTSDDGIKIDYEKLVRNYDLLWVNHIVGHIYDPVNLCLAGWDCESVVLLNPRILKHMIGFVDDKITIYKIEDDDKLNNLILK